MMNWIIDHADELINIASLVISAASAVAALTPTAGDDHILARLRRWLDILALNIGHAGSRPPRDPSSRP